MPCVMDGPLLGPDNYYTDGDWHRANDLTKMLCRICEKLERDGKEIYIHENSALADWWRKHKAADRRRRDEEAARNARQTEREAALAKLTPRERKLLNL